MRMKGQLVILMEMMGWCFMRRWRWGLCVFCYAHMIMMRWFY